MSTCMQAHKHILLCPPSRSVHLQQERLDYTNATSAVPASTTSRFTCLSLVCWLPVDLPTLGLASFVRGPPGRQGIAAVEYEMYSGACHTIARSDLP
jgi:hypothetical protein